MSIAVFVFNVWPYGYYTVWSHKFASDEWHSSGNSFCHMFSRCRLIEVLQEISYLVDNTPKYNIADMDIYSTGDNKRDVFYYSGLMLLPLAALLILFGVELLVIRTHDAVAFSRCAGD